MKVENEHAKMSFISHTWHATHEIK